MGLRARASAEGRGGYCDSFRQLPNQFANRPEGARRKYRVATPKRASKAVVVPAKRARIHSKEEQLVAHSLLGLTGPAAASPAPSPLNFSFNLVPMAR